MPMMDDLLEEFSKDTDTTVTATETEQPKETETPKEEPKETKEAPAEQSEQVDTKPEQVSEPKPDLSQVSKEDKAAHAFRRQLSKQKEKHAQEIEDLKKSFQTQFDEFKASLKPKEEPKTRKDFATDDEYIKYLNKQGLEEVLAEQKEEAKAEAERKAEEEANDAMTRTFATNSHNVFKDPASYEAYANRVSKALDNGLGEVLDQVPAVRDFVFRNPEGPIVLDKILQSREAFVKVMTQTDPTMMIIACHELANERPAEPQSAPVAQETVHQMPHIGKPGAQKVSADAGSMFNSDKDLISYIRNVGSRRR